MTSVPGTPMRGGRGTVVEFDEPRGWGRIRTEGGREYPFHCTAIVDGTRTIEVGAIVQFEVGAGRQGRWEAVGLRPCPDGGN